MTVLSVSEPICVLVVVVLIITSAMMVVASATVSIASLPRRHLIGMLQVTLVVTTVADDASETTHNGAIGVKKATVVNGVRMGDVGRTRQCQQGGESCEEAD
ncbi:MAG: hypothetical protein O7B81_10020 [Gammaproteobacteria bacterium]|nr:hypothetical protein [Gammaproteobacteria bacterium]